MVSATAKRRADRKLHKARAPIIARKLQLKAEKNALAPPRPKLPPPLPQRTKYANAITKKTHRKLDEARLSVKDAELLLVEQGGFLEAEGFERTEYFTQFDIAAHLDLTNQAKSFDLKLDHFGPYCLDYTQNGRNMLIGGAKGHVATFDWKTGRLGCEIQLKDAIRDATWLQNETMFAVAQKKYVYIYDQTGLEVHALKKHIDVNKLAFLPYHYLLASVGGTGFLKYQDISTGHIIAELRTRLGRCVTMTPNPWNAVINLGHTNGTVTMWAPNISTPLVTMLCHQGPVTDIAVDQGGRYMVTSGLDCKLKVWDVRKFTPLQEYKLPRPATSLSISQRGLLGVGWGSHISVWKDAFITKQTSPYMSHLQPGSSIHDLHFAPFDDVLGFGHSGGISSIVIPGSGEPNYDALSANPYQTKRQRQEAEVHGLLHKVQPDMISLDPQAIGLLEKDAKMMQDEVLKAEFEANNPNAQFAISVEKRKMRGKNRAMKKYTKKQANIIDAKKHKFMDMMERERKESENRKSEKGVLDSEHTSVLDRFKRRKN